MKSSVRLARSWISIGQKKATLLSRLHLSGSSLKGYYTSYLKLFPDESDLPSMLLNSLVPTGSVPPFVAPFGQEKYYVT